MAAQQTRTSFQCVGGTLLWGSDHPLTEADAKHLLAVFRDEWFAAGRVGDWEASQKAADLHMELNTAWAKAKDWARCSGDAR